PARGVQVRDRNQAIDCGYIAVNGRGAKRPGNGAGGPIARDGPLPSDFAGGGRLVGRHAAGRAREGPKWGALSTDPLGLSGALGAIFMLLQAAGNFPGGNMLLAIGIGTLVMAFTLLWVYSEFASAMPRAGGDYVFVSRALHPIAGWLMSWSQGLWLIFFWI